MPETPDITPDPQRLADQVGTLPAALLESARKALAKGNQQILGGIIKNRFTGQGPFPVGDHKLGVVSSRLRRSLRVTEPKIEGDAITFSIGSNVSYFAAHEFGFKGSVQVPGHTRRQSGIIAFKFGGQTTRRKIQGRDSFVRPHTRKVNLPARAPLATGIEESLPVWEGILSRALGVAATAHLDKGGPA